MNRTNGRKIDTDKKRRSNQHHLHILPMWESLCSQGRENNRIIIINFTFNVSIQLYLIGILNLLNTIVKVIIYQQRTQATMPPKRSDRQLRGADGDFLLDPDTHKWVAGKSTAALMEKSFDPAPRAYIGPLDPATRKKMQQLRMDAVSAQPPQATNEPRCSAKRK